MTQANRFRRHCGPQCRPGHKLLRKQPRLGLRCTLLHHSWSGLHSYQQTATLSTWCFSRFACQQEGPLERHTQNVRHGTPSARSASPHCSKLSHSHKPAHQRVSFIMTRCRCATFPCSSLVWTCASCRRRTKTETNRRRTTDNKDSDTCQVFNASVVRQKIVMSAWATIPARGQVVSRNRSAMHLSRALEKGDNHKFQTSCSLCRFLLPRIILEVNLAHSAQRGDWNFSGLDLQHPQ